MGHQCFVQASAAGQGSGHQPCGHPHPEASAQQLVHQQQLIGWQAAPAGLHRFRLGFPLQGRQSWQVFLHPQSKGILKAGAAALAAIVCAIGPLLPEQGHRFG